MVTVQSLIGWPEPLTKKRGAPHRLGGLDVYFDFDWRSVFHHNRAIFPNGQSLSRLAQRDCPDGKQPTLLLTKRDDVDPDIIETEDRYIVVVPIEDYLDQAGGDAAFTYYARLSGTPITQLASLGDVVFSSSELEDFLNENLTAEALGRWAATTPERRELLRHLAGAAPPTDPEVVAEAIRGLQIADLEVLREAVQYAARFDDEAGPKALLDYVTQSKQGRVAAAETLGRRLFERIQDVREQLAEYQTLIGTPGVTETDVQGFLERHPWIVGLPYVAARGRVQIPRGEVDFVLDRYDGFFDVVELKGPDEVLVSEDPAEGRTDRPPSASAFSLGPALADALAQAHLYRSILYRSQGLEDEYGLSDTRQPRIIIMLGRSEDLTDASREVLRELNLSLHRVEILPYDLVGRRTLGLLDNVEALCTDGSS